MTPRDLRVPSLYKTLLILALVFAPFYWLTFTEDGQRRTDLALMFVLGKPHLDAALDAFSSGLTESQVRATFPKLRLECADGANAFGDRLCRAEIGAFNGIPASAVTVFLAGESLRAVKVAYRRAYHRWIRDWVEARVGAGGEGEADGGRPQIGDGVAAWAVADGLLVMRDGTLAREDDPALLWVSRAALARRGGAAALSQDPAN